jgi:hypothetical protein
MWIAPKTYKHNSEPRMINFHLQYATDNVEFYNCNDERIYEFLKFKFFYDFSDNYVYYDYND